MSSRTSTFEKIQHDADQAMDLFRLPGKTAEALVYKLAGKPALPKIKNAAVDSFWNAALFGPRVLRDVAMGILSGTARFSWEVLKHLPLPVPMLESWKKERGMVTLNTKSALELFASDNRLPKFSLSSPPSPALPPRREGSTPS